MTPSDLVQKTCVPCSGGMPPLPEARVQELLRQIEGWRVEGGKEIVKPFTFKNFVQAVEFVNAITPVAEQEGHHPDLEVGWGKVVVRLTTHAIDGLTENDFILAAKIDQLPRP
ncbi:MAG TPA: 4a-hydroxytetrahydrobiopterin dehydratase [Chloroflexota bacterium]|nr:4a-hydroxytetrahydrobiopterin dehydratase [Chloroflexota bacterium]